MRKKDNGIVIRIKANSNVFSFNQEVPEVKAEQILRSIKKNFLYLQSRYRLSINVDPLKVETSVVNQTLL